MVVVQFQMGVQYSLGGRMEVAAKNAGGLSGMGFSGEWDAKIYKLFFWNLLGFRSLLLSCCSPVP